MKFEKKKIFNYGFCFIFYFACAIFSLGISIPLALVIASNGASKLMTIYLGGFLFVILYGGGIKFMQYLSETFEFLEIICRGIYYRVWRKKKYD